MAAQKPAGSRPSFGDGHWLVGKQVAPGTYWTQGASQLPPNATFTFAIVCYWQRFRGSRGGAAVGSDIVAGQDIATILPTDAVFASHNCGTWSVLPRKARLATTIGNGAYAVGVDLAPGTYTTAGSNGVMSEAGGSICFWERLRDFTGGAHSVITGANPPGRATVTIKRTDKGFESQGCKTWFRS